MPSLCALQTGLGIRERHPRRENRFSWASARHGGLLRPAKIATESERLPAREQERSLRKETVPGSRPELPGIEGDETTDSHESAREIYIPYTLLGKA
jgi:hypothetical protein